MGECAHRVDDGRGRAAWDLRFLGWNPRQIHVPVAGAHFGAPGPPVLSTRRSAPRLRSGNGMVAVCAGNEEVARAACRVLIRAGARVRLWSTSPLRRHRPCHTLPARTLHRRSEIPRTASVCRNRQKRNVRRRATRTRHWRAAARWRSCSVAAPATRRPSTSHPSLPLAAAHAYAVIYAASNAYRVGVP